MLDSDPREKPLSVQIFGADPAGLDDGRTIEYLAFLCGQVGRLHGLGRSHDVDDASLPASVAFEPNESDLSR